MIHRFVRVGLLPATSTRSSVGDAGFTSVVRPAIFPQLLALLGYRRQTRSRHSLAIQLWAHGHDVSAPVVHAALLSALPRLPRVRSDRELDQLDRFATSRRSKFMRLFRPGRLGRLGTHAAATLAPVLFGAIERIDDEAAAGLERLVGLHRGRTDTFHGSGAWLASRPSFAWNLMLRSLSPETIRTYVAGLDAEDLAPSREHARFLVHDLPRFARAVEARMGRGFAGFGWLARLDERHAAVLGLLAVVIDRYPAAARRLQRIIDGLTPSITRRDLLLELHATYARQHPLQRRDLRRYGLEGLASRGLARPLRGVEDLVARIEAAEEVA